MYLYPTGLAANAAALAITDEAVDGHLCAGLDEREVVATEPHPAVLSEYDDLANSNRVPFQVGQG